MKDFTGKPLYPHQWIVYVTLHGHKPVLNMAYVETVETGRARVMPTRKSVGSPPEPKAVWLHQPENIVVIE